MLVIAGAVRYGGAGLIVGSGACGPQRGPADPVVVAAQQQVNRVRAAGGRCHHHGDHRPGWATAGPLVGRDRPAQLGQVVGQLGTHAACHGATSKRPRISCCQLERLYDLVEGGSGVAAVSIFRQRGIDEVEDVNIDVNGERTRREMVKCSPGGTGWIGGECLAGGHAQAEPVSLLALPAGGHAWLHPEPRHLAWLKQRPGPKRVGEGIHATGQGQRVR
jgi:hypothetical protein